MVEKSDEFDECVLNHQNFPYQNFALRKFRYCIFYGYNLLTWVCQGSSCYVRTWNPEVPSSDYPHSEDKDPLEGKKLPNLSGPYLSKVIPSLLWSIASCNLGYNADVTRLLKQAKCSFTKNCYTKLTPAQKYEIYNFSILASTL